MKRVEYASKWNRFIAFWIDVFVLNVVLALVMTVTTALGGESQDAMGRVFDIYFTLTILYYTVMHASPYQATLGKMLLGMKVVDADGGKISYLRSFARYIVMAIEFMFFLPLFVIFFSSKNRTLHDMAVGSFVTDLEVQNPGKYRTARRAAPLMLVVGILLPGIVGTYYVDTFLNAVQGDMAMTGEMQMPSGQFALPTSATHSQVVTRGENGEMHIEVHDETHWEFSTSQAVPASGMPSQAEGSDYTQQLFALAKGGKDEDFIAIQLITKGADVNDADAMGRTPLFYAVKQHHVEMVKVLVFKGAKTNVKDAEGVSINMLAKNDEALQEALNYADGG